MLIKMHPDDANPSTLPPATACGNCGTEERRLLHHVRHRGIFRRLCTSCVLRLHPQCFCPTCFQVYPPAPSLDAITTCFKCYSSSHSHCVRPGGAASHPTPYVCPLCLHPNSPIFKLKSAEEANVEEASDANLKNCRVMDRDAAKKLLAAAKIASMSMNKAAASAKAEAERRAKVAAYTRKRAKEALEYVANLVMKEKLRKSEGGLPVPYGGTSCYTSGKTPTISMDRENRNSNVSSCYKNGNVVNSFTPIVASDGRIGSSGNADRVDSSGLALVAFNGVGLKESEKMRGGISRQGGGSADSVPMDVDNKGNNGKHEKFMNLESGSENVDAQGEQMEDVIDDDDDEDEDDDESLVQFVEDQMQEENILDSECHRNGTES